MSTEPTWIELLRQACASSSQSAVAARIGYSAGALSAVLAGKYGGNLDRVQQAVEGALMDSVVDCPVIGELPRQKCMEHQRTPLMRTNPSRIALYRACRGGCPNSLIKSGQAADKEPV